MNIYRQKWIYFFRLKRLRHRRVWLDIFNRQALLLILERLFFNLFLYRKIPKSNGFKSRDVSISYSARYKVFLWHREHRSQQGVCQIHPVFVDCIESMVLVKGLQNKKKKVTRSEDEPPSHSNGNLHERTKRFFWISRKGWGERQGWRWNKRHVLNC